MRMPELDRRVGTGRRRRLGKDQQFHCIAVRSDLVTMLGIVQAGADDYAPQRSKLFDIDRDRRQHELGEPVLRQILLEMRTGVRFACRASAAANADLMSCVPDLPSTSGARSARRDR